MLARGIKKSPGITGASERAKRLELSTFTLARSTSASCFQWFRGLEGAERLEKH